MNPGAKLELMTYPTSGAWPDHLAGVINPDVATSHAMNADAPNAIKSDITSAAMQIGRDAIRRCQLTCCQLADELVVEALLPDMTSSLEDMQRTCQLGVIEVAKMCRSIVEPTY